MQTETLFRNQMLSVVDYRCNATPQDAPFTEQFDAHSISYVRTGSFGCDSRGRRFELVPGSILIGRTGEEYRCTHDHHLGGDECLSFQLAPELVEQLNGSDKAWSLGGIPPVPGLTALGELAWVIAQGNGDLGLDEIGLILLKGFVETVSQWPDRDTTSDPRLRKRAANAALWIDENSHHALDLNAMAKEAGLSPFHFLRTFTRTMGVTPHQYLVRSRLRRAARLLVDPDLSVTHVAMDVGFNDLSNFVRTFRRASGMSPSQFRRVASGERKIFQD